MVRSLNVIEMLVLLTVCVGGAVALFSGTLSGSWLSVAIVFAAAQVIWIVLRDITDFIIPDTPVVALGLAGAVVRVAGSPDGWPFELTLPFLDGLVCGVAFLIVREVFYRLRGYDGMGFGDVKLAAACGVLVGLQGFAWSVFIASAGGLVVALILSLLRPELKLDRLPFGALLAPACWSIWVAQIWGST